MKFENSRLHIVSRVSSLGAPEALKKSSSVLTKHSVHRHTKSDQQSPEGVCMQLAVVMYLPRTVNTEDKRHCPKRVVQENHD
jgi:hypothetical protein